VRGFNPEDWVWESSTLRGNERLIHVIMGRVANAAHSFYLWMRPEWIALRAGCSVKTVTRTLTTMIEMGLLREVGFLPTPEGDVRRTYELLFPDILSDNLSDILSKQLDDTVLTYTKEHTRTIENQKRTYRRVAYTPEFETLWNTYPRKTEKAGAFTSYRAALNSGASHEELASATEAYAKECRSRGTEDQFIKHGKTFFGAKEPYRDYLTAAWVPPPGVVEVARVWDGVDAGTIGPLAADVERPRHPAGGFVAADGTRYRIDGAGRRYVL
jgi:hypothetical protein